MPARRFAPNIAALYGSAAASYDPTASANWTLYPDSVFSDTGGTTAVSTDGSTVKNAAGVSGRALTSSVGCTLKVSAGKRYLQFLLASANRMNVTGFTRTPGTTPITIMCAFRVASGVGTLPNGARVLAPGGSGAIYLYNGNADTDPYSLAVHNGTPGIAPAAGRTKGVFYFRRIELRGDATTRERIYDNAGAVLADLTGDCGNTTTDGIAVGADAAGSNPASFDWLCGRETTDMADAAWTAFYNDAVARCAGL